ncbi:MAG: sarcosine oxidase subunit alpha [Proteobacteria bacterium]|nr:MAG: sarcosine oxidase subunit alpha [Pseudomonadota bacterium]
MTSPSKHQSQPFRLTSGGLIDRAAAIPFMFDGREYYGYPGDTLASALLANGVHLVGRSFKYHRPRGILYAGPEEPNALVELRTGARREPNTRATVAELYSGLVANSQNRWPSLAFDLMAINGLAAPIFPAGFYYKTFMWPAAFWEKVYEPLIRRAAGLGRAAREPDPDKYERSHLFCDVLVVGSGPAGLTAALAAARSGARVVLCEQDFRLGGHLLANREEIDGKAALDWVCGVEQELKAEKKVRVLRRTTVFGIYDHGICGAVERVSDHLAEPPPFTVRQRYWKIAARRIIVATGAIERPIVFPKNDRPGIMMASAVRTYIERFAVLPGRHAVVFMTDDSGWQTVEALQRAGASIAAVVDPRTEASAFARHGTDAPLFVGATITGTRGRLRLSSVTVKDRQGREHEIVADLLAMAGGWDPVLHLTSHLGHKPKWDERILAFVPGDLPAHIDVTGAAAGRFGLDTALKDGARAGSEAARSLGLQTTYKSPPTSAAPPSSSQAPSWSVAKRSAKSFVDFQNDVTAADIALAAREGYRSVEHAKRYTTLGMATDQGKSSGVNGLAILADVTGRTIAETGTTTFRPPYTPVAIGAIAGRDVGKAFRPTRLTPTHEWASEQNAVFVEVGQWLRAQWYPKLGETDWRESVNREVRTVRSAVGVCDVSTLGKIEVIGPDAERLLDFVYANTISTLKVGRMRYGLMLREDGHVLDDGTVSRIGEHRFFLTTGTGHADQVLRHLEFCHQVLKPSLDVSIVPVTERWAQLAVAGPRSRELVAKIVDGFDLSTSNFPHLSVAEITICGGIPARLYRVSFSGELGYEIGVPADYGDALIRCLAREGEPLGLAPYGTEALAVLRIEKGFPAAGELNGQTTTRDLGLERLLSTKKDYVGRALQQLPAFNEPDRPVLVSFAPVNRSDVLRAGSHFLDLGAAPRIENDLGYMTSAVYSPTFGHYIGLGLLKRGKERIGERVRAYDPVRNGDVVVEIGPPCRYDPEGELARA